VRVVNPWERTCEIFTLDQKSVFEDRFAVALFESRNNPVEAVAITILQSYTRG
jgi:hypothetical protein